MTFRPLHDRIVVCLVEAEEKKDRVHDAMHATEEAIHVARKTLHSFLDRRSRTH